MQILLLPKRTCNMHYFSSQPVNLSTSPIALLKMGTAQLSKPPAAPKAVMKLIRRNGKT